MNEATLMPVDAADGVRPEQIKKCPVMMFIGLFSWQRVEETV